jgi:hypothetical protein
MAPPTYPRAREDGILTESLDEDLLVYDETRDTAHRLNRTAAAVWRACDGTRSTADLVGVLRDEVGEVADEDLVAVTLDELTTNGLLDDAAERDREAMRRSRRQFIRRVGLVGTAALALPIVHSIAAPDPAAAQTGTACSTCACACTSCTSCACYCTSCV